MTTIDKQATIKNLVDKYVRGEISADDFYSELTELVGPDQFKELLEELGRVIPDPSGT